MRQVYYNHRTGGWYIAEYDPDKGERHSKTEWFNSYGPDDADEGDIKWGEWFKDK